MHTNPATVTRSAPFHVGGHLRWRSRALHALPVLIFMMGCFLAYAPSAYALTLYSQTDASSDMSQNFGYADASTDFTATGGEVLDKVRLWVGSGDGAVTFVSWSVYDVTTSTRVCENEATTIITTRTYYEIDVDDIGNGGYNNCSGFTFVAGHDYSFEFWSRKGGGAYANPTLTKGNGTTPYMEVADTGGFGGDTPIGDGILDTHAIRFELPVNKSTVSSTTFDVSWVYYTTADGSAVDAQGYFITAVDAVDNEILIPPEDQVVFFADDPDDAGVYRHEFSLTLPEGSVSIGIKTFVCDVSIETGEQDCDLGYYGYGPLISTHINVVTSTAPDSPLFNGSDIYLGYNFSSEDCALNLNPFEESTFSFSGCAGYILIPNSDSWNAYSQLDDQLMLRFPFSYAPQLVAVRDAMYGNVDGEPASISVEILGGTLTLLSRDMVAAVPFAGVINTMLGAFVWILLIWALYAMVLKMHDKQTAV